MGELWTVARISEAGVDVSRHGSRLLAEAHVASMRLLDKSLGRTAEYEVSDSRVGSG